MFAANDFQHLKAVMFTVAQPDIEDDKAGLARRNRRKRLRAGGGLPGLEALVIQNSSYQIADVVFVVDD